MAFYAALVSMVVCCSEVQGNFYRQLQEVELADEHSS